jgi:hypothetical protein
VCERGRTERKCMAAAFFGCRFVGDIWDIPSGWISFARKHNGRLIPRPHPMAQHILSLRDMKNIIVNLSPSAGYYFQHSYTATTVTNTMISILIVLRSTNSRHGFHPADMAKDEEPNSLSKKCLVPTVQYYCQFESR